MDVAPTASQLLGVWENAHAQTPVQRARALLVLATPGESPAARATFSVGRRDRALLDLRERIFGPRLTGTASCPDCAQEIELDFAADDIRASGPFATDAPEALSCDGYDLHFRLPTCDDLDALDRFGESSGRKSALVERCVLRMHCGGEETTASEMPDTVAAALARRMTELDPQGDVRLALRCPRCAHEWSVPFDIGTYLWLEIQSWAQRTLRDVHELARAYGWRETDILTLSAARRQAYLDLIRQ